MKKFVALLLTLVLTFSLAACGAEGGVKDDEAAGPGSFKIGTLDTGSADATTAPLLNQLKLTVETLGCELVTATSTGMSAEETLVALQNLIAAGCDAILVPAAMISPAKVAEICDPEGVYWGTYFYKFEEGTEDYEAAMNSEYFVGTTYEDDVDSAYWATSVLGKLGCKNLCMIGLPTGGTTANMRDEGIAKACEEYGMTVLAEERDFTLTFTAAGGATIAERFLTAYPECDGIIIAGMTQYCLPGIVQTLEQTGNINKIKVAGIDFNEFQFDYMEQGALHGIVGGHFAGPTYTAIHTVIKIDILPLEADALATPQASCDKQLQNTAKVKIQCVQLFKESPCILFGQCIHRPSTHFWSVHLFHGVLLNQVLLFGIAKNKGENIVMVLDGFFGEGLAVLRPILIAKPCQILRDLNA